MNALTDSKLKALLRENIEKPRKIADGGGLFILQQPTGAPLWRLKYRVKGVDGKLIERQASFGAYPAVGLAEAREKARDLKAMVKAGVDPSKEKERLATEARRAALNTVGAVLDEWYAVWLAGKAEKTIDNQKRVVSSIREGIGHMPISEVTVADIKCLLLRVKKQRSVGMAHRCLNTLNGQEGVMPYAVVSGLIDRNPAVGLKIVLPQKERTEHHPALTDPAEFGTLLADIEAWGNLTARLGLKLVALTLCRPGELLAATWDQMVLEGPDPHWAYRATKTRTARKIPLCRQAVEALLQLREIALGVQSQWVLAGPYGGKAGVTCLSGPLLKMGYGGKHVPHGFRASARTILDEICGVEPHLVEHALGHVVRDVNGRAYNRTTQYGRIRTMLQAWADFCDERRAGLPMRPAENVISIRVHGKGQDNREAPEDRSVAGGPEVCSRPEAAAGTG